MVEIESQDLEKRIHLANWLEGMETSSKFFRICSFLEMTGAR
jgi:hypothetical protein